MIPDVVYIDMKGTNSIVSVKAKPAFEVVIEVITRDRVGGDVSVAR